MQPWIILGLELATVGAAGWFLSVPLARILEGGAPFRGVEAMDRGLLRVFGIRSPQDQTAGSWIASVLLLAVLGIVVVGLALVFQDRWPNNPRHWPAFTWDLALNTAVSFVTNTNWQNYSGESLSPLVQSAALAVQNFLSAATGLAVMAALVRGIARTDGRLGNFWVDLVRLTLWILLPLSLVLGLFLVSQGVVQTNAVEVTASPLAGGHQTLLVGPVASQEAIKELGTNGGGYFNANSAHPFENPTSWSNVAETLAMLLIPVASVFAFGRVVRDRRQAWSLLGVMTVVLITAVVLLAVAESAGGINWEGKETRFGVLPSALFSVVTTSTSSGAVNAMHDSYTALGGLVPLALMQLGEVVFGGVGSGLYGMLVLVLLTVFVGGLLVGRTPEYLGKTIEPRDMTLVSVALLITPVLVLLGTAAGALWPATTGSLANTGPHGFTELLYAFSSAANNNGSAFAGFGGNTLFFNLTLAAAMFVGRYGVMIPVLWLAGSLASRPVRARSAGTLPTHTLTFSALLVFFLLLVAALNFVPAWTLGPVAEAVSPGGF